MTPVPADDLPTNIVPQGDLPEAMNSPTAPKAEFGSANKLGPKDVPDMPPVVQGPQKPTLDPMRYEPSGAEAILGIASGIPAQLIGRGVGAVNALMPSNYGTQEGAARAQATGSKVADALTYEPRSRSGKDNLDAIGKLISGSKLEGIGPMSPAGGVDATKVFSGKPVAPKVAAAQKAGFATTPTEAGAGAFAKTAEGLSGEPKLAKAISNKNASVAMEKIKADMGIPKDAELNLETLKSIRGKAGQEYASVRQTGRVMTDDAYTTQIDRLGEKYKSAAADFPGLAREDVEKVVAGLRRASFDANSGVDMIMQLRESADQAFRAGNNGLAKVYRGGAEALESMIERYLETSGQNTTLVNNYRKARELIAKSYQAEKALVGDTLNPQAYRKALEKGKPLTGGAKEVGEFARDFERSAQKPTKANVGSPTFADLITALLTGGKSMGKEALMLGARPATRAVLGSRPYQRLQASQPQAAMPVPAPGAAQALGLAAPLSAQEGP